MSSLIPGTPRGFLPLFEIDNSSEYSPKELFDLGLKHLDINSHPDELARSIERIQNSADRGCHEAQYMIGVIYSSGELVPLNIPKAVQYFNYAEGNGNAAATTALGDLYYLGTHVEKDINEAIRHYKINANLGDNTARYTLGLIYLTGKDIDQDLKEALHFLNLAAENGHKRAKYQLGLLHLKGKYVPKDIPTAVGLIAYAATHGHANAQVTLATLYCLGRGVPKDYNVALEWLQKAEVNSKIPVELESGVKQRRTEMIFVIGMLHHKGVSIPKNSLRALELLRKAASDGCIEAYHTIAEIYMNGEDGVPVNLAEASRNCELAARQGRPVPIGTRISLSFKRMCS